MTPFEKLLLRRARNTDLKRAAQWLCNLTYANAGCDVWAMNPVGRLAEMMECFGLYAETEDPDALRAAEVELTGALLRGLISEEEISL